MIDPAETALRLNQIRDLESELADLHGYPRAPHAPGSALDRLDPATGDRIGLGCVIARIRREARQHRQTRQFVARDQVGEGEEQAGEQGSAGVHGSGVRTSVANLSVSR